jgi:hypothetical protein
MGTHEVPYLTMDNDKMALGNFETCDAEVYSPLWVIYKYFQWKSSSLFVVKNGI